MKGPFSLLLCTKGSIPKPTANDRNNSMKCLVKFVESLGLYLSTDILSSNLFRKVSKEDVSCDRLPTRRAFQLLANKGSKFNVGLPGSGVLRPVGFNYSPISRDRNLIYGLPGSGVHRPAGFGIAHMVSE